MLIKITLAILVILIVLVCVYFYYLSFTAVPPQPPQDKTTLRPCPDKPNCVSSMSDKPYASISPIHYSMSNDQARTNIITAIRETGGAIEQEDNHYLRASFTSKIFRFVDDVEVVQDIKNKMFHIRSASRSGHSDFSVNRKRVEKIRAQFKGKHTQHNR